VSLVATATISLLVWPFLGNELERSVTPATLLASVIPVLFLDWREHTSPGRAHRLTLGPVIGAAVIALIAGGMLDGWPPMAAGVAAAVALAVQLGSPWKPKVPKAARPSDPAAGDGRRAAAPSGHADAAIQSIATPVFSQAAPAPSGSAKERAEVSPKSRLITLLLNIIPGTMGICGIHRLYSGQILSGLLWLVTLGLLGIGQIIDLVLIAMGEYNDSSGRPILRWSSRSREAARRAAPQAWTTVYPTQGMGRIWFDRLLALVGALILAAALAVGFLVAINVPAVLDSGASAGILEGPFRMAFELEEALGPRWTDLFLRIGSIVATMLGTLGAGLLLISRRGSSLMHVARVVLACVAFLVALITISNTFGSRYSWETIMTLVARGQGSEAFLRFTEEEALVVLTFTAICGIAGVMLLAWPERRWRTAPIQAVSYPGAVGHQGGQRDAAETPVEEVAASAGDET
jgi:hypothetical protein